MNTEASLFMELPVEEKGKLPSFECDEDYIIYGFGLSKTEYRHLRFCDVSIIQGIICAIVRNGRGSERVAIVPMSIHTEVREALDNIFDGRNLKKKSDMKQPVLSRLKSYHYDYEKVWQYYNRDIEEDFAFAYAFEDGKVIKTKT